MTMGSVEIGEEHPLAVGGVDSVAEAPSEGFWAGYWKTLKPLAVEEPVDVWIHRPLAYVLAKALYPTPVSPNLVTMISIVFGVLGASCFLADFRHHMLLGGLAIFVSAIFDCADGQLARMRGTSSAFGRMLDGVADLVVSVAAVGGGSYWSFRIFGVRFGSEVDRIISAARDLNGEVDASSRASMETFRRLTAAEDLPGFHRIADEYNMRPDDRFVLDPNVRKEDDLK